MTSSKTTILDNLTRSCKKYHNNGEFSTGSISFQASKQVKTDDGISLTTNTIKCFLGKIGKNYFLQKKSNIPSDFPKSQEVVVNEVIETIILTCNSLTDRAEPLYEATDEEDLLSLFKRVLRGIVTQPGLD